MRDYTKIKAWALADDLAVEVYRHTKGFPREELYGLTSQIRRAAVSVAANIAEGASRGTLKDYLHFLHVARGSLSETQYYIHLSQRLELWNPGVEAPLGAKAKETAACLHGLIQAVEKDLHEGGQ